MKKYFENIAGAIVSLVKGFAVTLKFLFMKPVTVQYPDEKIALSPRFRGMLKLLRDENGNEICDACGICSLVCPVKVISIEAFKDESGKRKAKSYSINFGRCMFCGLCAENCPKNALCIQPNMKRHFLPKKNLHTQKTGF
ncbi:MAG: NADH-quinone oxidoreductase subunit I [Candidatus Omnitrophota bacterium]